MEVLTWLLIGAIIGVISTTWQKKLTISRLLLSMIIGSIGSVSGGVIGYLIFGSKLEGFDLSVFSTAFILTCLLFILRKRVRLLIASIQRKKSSTIILLPERSSLALGM